jgi:hypothetical protein
VVECDPYKVEVAGPIPAAPTTQKYSIRRNVMDKELTPIFEAIEYCSKDKAISEAWGDIIQQGKQLLGLSKPKEPELTINWGDVYRKFPEAVKGFATNPTWSDKYLAFQKLSAHPDVKLWMLKNFRDQSKIINTWKSLPDTDPRKKKLEPAKIHAQGEIIKRLKEIYPEAVETWKRNSMTTAARSKMEDKEIQDIAKVITEDIRTNNGLELVD